MEFFFWFWTLTHAVSETSSKLGKNGSVGMVRRVRTAGVIGHPIRGLSLSRRLKYSVYGAYNTHCYADNTRLPQFRRQQSAKGFQKLQQKVKLSLLGLTFDKVGQEIPIQSKSWIIPGRVGFRHLYYSWVMESRKLDPRPTVRKRKGYPSVHGPCIMFRPI